MTKPLKNKLIDIAGSSEGFYDPDLHQLVKRNGRWIPVDKQLFRWRKRHPQPTKWDDQMASIEAKVKNLFKI